MGVSSFEDSPIGVRDLLVITSILGKFFVVYPNWKLASFRAKLLEDNSIRGKTLEDSPLQR